MSRGGRGAILLQKGEGQSPWPRAPGPVAPAAQALNCESSKEEHASEVPPGTDGRQSLHECRSHSLTFSGSHELINRKYYLSILFWLRVLAGHPIEYAARENGSRCPSSYSHRTAPHALQSLSPVLGVRLLCFRPPPVCSRPPSFHIPAVTSHRN